MYTHNKNTIVAGHPVNEAKKAIIMLHGRGATAQDIISLAGNLRITETAIFAPQAENRSWYPYSFMEELENNQPALDSALNAIDNLVGEIYDQGIPASQLYFLGFSQGACLALEYVTRYAQQYGGVIAFTGGLIGKDLDKTSYSGNFEKTPILITTGDPDAHVPLSRVEDSVKLLKEMHADVTLKVYKGRQHTIQIQEIELARELVLKSLAG